MLLSCSQHSHTQQRYTMKYLELWSQDHLNHVIRVDDKHIMVGCIADNLYLISEWFYLELLEI